MFCFVIKLDDVMVNKALTKYCAVNIISLFVKKEYNLNRAQFGLCESFYSDNVESFIIKLGKARPGVYRSGESCVITTMKRVHRSDGESRMTRKTKKKSAKSAQIGRA